MRARLDQGELAAIWASERVARRVDISGRVVLDLVAFEAGIAAREIASYSRRRIACWSRWALVYAVHRFTNATLFQAAKLVGRSRRAVSALLARAEALFEQDGEFQCLARIIAEALEAA